MKIKITEKLRNLEIGSEFIFDKKINCLVGDNGCGKSTLVKALRGKVNGKSDNDWDLNADDNYKLSKNIEVEGLSDATLFLSKEDEPGLQLDAYSFVMKGGMSLKDMSEGEKYFKMVMKTLSDALIAAQKGKSVMVVFDEIDSHFDAKHQLCKWYNKVDRFIPY